MINKQWQPTASIESLNKRARIIASIRQFFADRNVLEVETPLLSAATVTDPYLYSLETSVSGKTFYLQTSPEYAMKRLLAAGSGDIYQICRAFRDDEQGALHNPEFTLLEWYRLDFSHHDLMDEMDLLLQQVLGCGAAERLSYQALFCRHLQIDPHEVSLDQLAMLAEKNGLKEVVGVTEPDKDLYLQWLMSEVIEPQLGQEVPCFIYDYPISQAALAQIRQEQPPVAERFEVYFKGIELANGFHELSDSEEQAQRFQRDLAKRQQLNSQIVPIDQHLLCALAAGLPDCSGVALGIDRLIVLALGKPAINDVLVFPINRA